MRLSYSLEPFLPDNNTFVYTLFESAAATFPHRIALIWGEETYTYQQLNEKAEKLSRKISHICRQEEIIGISSTRGTETIIALIAILKAGKAYLPLDTNQPKERLNYYLLDAKIKTCISLDDEKKFFELLDIKFICAHEDSYENLPILSKPVNPLSVYVLYTSGSTGKPKGVCMGQKAMVNLLRWQAKNSQANEQTKTLQFAPLIFDVSFQEIFSTLTTGGTLVLINEELRADPYELLQCIKKQQVNRIFLPFVALQVLTDAASASNHYPSSLQEVITAGEQLKITPNIINFFTQLPHCNLVNQYGPTESHVATAFTLQGSAATWPKLPPIGKVIDNTQIFILDEIDYGTEQSLQIIRERAGELAAVLVEPVQSRRPEFVPIDFLKQVWEITEKSGTALIFDEVITGFRMHPGGAQALFNISADIGTYGKVIGGGLPIGVIAGKRAFMDALDGGFWNFGDASFPETGVTYFAGTFVRHPLVLATVKASLLYMKEKGPGLQTSINNKAEYLSEKLNSFFTERQLPIYVAQFGSLWKIKFKEEPPLYELIFALMREKGIHIWDGFPCFMTEAHSEEDVEKIIATCICSADEMISAGFYENSNIDDDVLQQNANVAAATNIYNQRPRLGRDKDGNPAWFVPDPKQPGKYLQLQSNY